MDKSNNEIRTVCYDILRSHGQIKVRLALETLINRDRITVPEAQRAWEGVFGFRLKAIPDRSRYAAKAESSLCHRWRRFVSVLRGQSAEDREIEVLCLVTMRVSGQYQVRRCLESLVGSKLVDLSVAKRGWRDVFKGRLFKA